MATGIRKNKQGISTAYRTLILPGFLIACVCFLMVGASGCGNSKLDSEENKQLLKDHALSSLELKKNNLRKHIEGSWLAVQPYYDENNDTHWSIIGSSESSLDENVLSDMDILVVINAAQSSAQYKSTTGKVSTGTSEYAYLSYYDAHTGDCYGEEMLSAGALPDTTSAVPNYTISDREIRKAIEKRLSSHIDPDYDTDAFVIKETVLKNVNVEHQSIVVIPQYVTEVSAGAGDDLKRKKNLSAIELPENIDIINLPDMHKKVILGVYEGSYAEQYAIENGYLYYRIGTLDAFLPEGIYEYDKVNYPGGEYGYLHIPESVTYIRDGVFSTNSAVFVVHKDSYAEQAALESQHIYCYEGQQDQLYVPDGARFFIPKDVIAATSVIHMPGDYGFKAGDQMYEYLVDNADHLTLAVPKGSYAESCAQEIGIPVIDE